MIDAWIDPDIDRLHLRKEAACEWAATKFKWVEKSFKNRFPEEDEREFYLKSLALSWGMDDEFDGKIEEQGFDNSIVYYILGDEEGMLYEFNEYCEDCSFW